MIVPMRLRVRMKRLTFEASMVAGNSGRAASRDASRSDSSRKLQLDGSASVRSHISRLGPCAFLAKCCEASCVAPIIMIGGGQF